jgi:tetratricopeptide (TPR) repeat protein
MRLAKSARWLVPGLMLVASGAYAQDTVQDRRQRAEPAIQKPAGTAAKEKLLDDAEALMKAGKPAVAYKLLEPFEFDRAGEERFDYLIGIAALDSGKPDKATLAFERVLAEDPNYAGARLDMARAYYQLGDIERAKTEFETVLDQNPSDAARATIQKYLDEITARESGKKTLVSGYIEGKVGRDTNVNNASEVPNNIITPTLYTTNAELADSYYGAGAGGEIKHDMNANWQLYAGADMSLRNNYRQKSFDSFDLEGRAGVVYGTGTDRYRVGISGGQSSLGGARHYDSSGVNADLRRTVSASRQLTVFGQYMQYRYADPLLQLNDINQLVAGVGMLQMFQNGKSALSGSLYFGTENDVGPATLSRPAGGRTDGIKHFVGIRAGGQAVVGDRAKLYFSAGEQFGNFSNVNPLISGHRSDRLSDLTVGVNWYLDNLWIVRPQLVRYINSSNVATYAYDRNDFSLTIRRNFK